jgi:hypothetical protein
LSVIVRTGGHGADGQAGVGLEELADALHLVVELAAVRGREPAERLHGDLELPARAALVPDSGDRSVDEEHGKVAGLATGQCAVGGPAGIEQRAGMGADRVGVEVRQ